MKMLHVYALKNSAWIFLMSHYIFAGSAFAQSKPTHCGSDEVTYFSCRIRSESSVASLCGRQLDLPGTNDSDILLDYRLGPLGRLAFKYPDRPVSIGENKFLGHHEKPYGGGYVSDEVLFYLGGILHEVYVSEEGDAIATVVARQNGRAASCARGSITNALWGLILSLPASAKR